MKTSLPVGIAFLAASLIPELRADLFQDPIQITSEGSPLFVESPGYATPCLADVDGDGIKDKTLVPAADDRKGTPAEGPMGSSRIWVDDLNGDQKLDILVGDSSTSKDGKRGGHVWVFLRK